MLPTLLILAIVYLSCILFLRVCMACAPEGYEDATGFHRIQAPALDDSAAFDAAVHG